MKENGGNHLTRICISTGQEEQEFTSPYIWTQSLVMLDIDPKEKLKEDCGNHLTRICISTGQEEQEFTSTYTWTHSIVMLDIDP